MKKKVAVVALLASIMMLCFVLIGCGSSDPKANFIGTWQAESMSTSDGTNYSSSDLESIGGMTLTLNEDGTASLEVAGQTETCTWEVSSATEGTLVSGDVTEPMTLSGDTLTASDNYGDSIVFKKAS